MKLAEALSLRADRHRRLAQLVERVKANAQVQEGDEPGEDPNQLIAEFEDVAREFEDLVRRINRTNLSVTLADGRTMTDAIAHRDTLKFHLSLWRQAAEAAGTKQVKGLRTEVKFVSTINVRDARQRADAYAKEYRELDSAIQAANWLNELLD